MFWTHGLFHFILISTCIYLKIKTCKYKIQNLLIINLYKPADLMNIFNTDTYLTKITVVVTSNLRMSK
jgi:hypothetical protein